jgi:hypothetical protein
MVTKKTIDLGEYVINVSYDNETGSLSVEILDELYEIIESVNITNLEDSKDDDNDDDAIIDMNFNLN